jgi:putative DNA primase/helicase
MTAKITNFPDKVDIVLEDIPIELRSKDRWLNWRWELRGDKRTKPPFKIVKVNGKENQYERASVTSPNDWSSFQDVVDNIGTGRFAGIGFVLTDADDILAYDLDHCLNIKNGNLEVWAEKLIKELDSYTEITPSGDGLRVIIRGDVPADGRQQRHLTSPDGKNQGAVECYKNKRYITVTGIHYPFSPKTIEERPDTIWKNFFENNKTKEVKTLFTNGKAKKLFEGDWKDDYGSQSDADLALCRYLADVVDGDEEKLNVLFKQSKLFRPKWDEQHYGDGRTYGAATIQKAIESYQKSYSLTDTGDAKRFAKLVSGDVRYCNGDWYIWDGKRLVLDSTYRIYTYIDRLGSAIVEESRQCEFEDRKKKLVSHAKALESRSKTESVLALSRAREPIPIRSIDDFDSNPYAFNCANGIMENGNLKPHDFSELITKISPVSYDAKADAPTWYKFLDQVVGNQEMIDYLARCVGYSMTGLNVHQVILFVYGLGANGKSTFINTIMQVLGDYSRVIPSDVLMVGKEQHPTALADLRGVRMALASELEEGKRFNEQLLKWLTGEERIVARRMHENFFEFSPRFKLWIVGNHKPTLRGNDYAIRRRFHLIPFETTIPKEKQDPFLKDALRNELDGILNWCVKGFLDWMKQGLNPPSIVLNATDEYFEEQDTIAHFLKEETVETPEARIRHKFLYDKYAVYAKQRNEYVLSSKMFAQKMAERGIKKEITSESVFWLGVLAKEEPKHLELM